MNRANVALNLEFPCECVSARTSRQNDPWSAVSRNKLLPDGTKEQIINLVADEPKTLSQLAKALSLSVPTVHRHVNEMLSSELIRDSIEWERLHPKERYYEPNFPIVNAADCAEMEKICGELSSVIADVFTEALPKFEAAFKTTGLDQKGWRLEDLSQCIYARIQRYARKLLEDQGKIQPPRNHRNGIRWSFWAEQNHE